ARANGVWRMPSTGSVLAIFHGPQAYVSPNWYPAKAEHGKVVPTWNYQVVHAHGTLRWIDDAAWLRALVTRLPETLAATVAGVARPWAVADAHAEYLDTMLRAIIGFEITITKLQGKFKLSQNRAAADVAGVIEGLRNQSADDPTAVAMQALRKD